MQASLAAWGRQPCIVDGSSHHAGSTLNVSRPAVLGPEAGSPDQSSKRKSMNPTRRVDGRLGAREQCIFSMLTTGLNASSGGIARPGRTYGYLTSNHSGLGCTGVGFNFIRLPAHRLNEQLILASFARVVRLMIWSTTFHPHHHNNERIPSLTSLQLLSRCKPSRKSF